MLRERPAPVFRPAGESDEDDSDEDGFEMSGLTRRRNIQSTSTVPFSANGYSNNGVKNGGFDDQENWDDEAVQQQCSPIRVTALSPNEEARIACTKGDITKMQSFLDSGIINVNAHFPDEYTPLMTAAAHGHSDLVKLLLQRGADVQIYSRGMKTTALMAAVACTLARDEEDILECVKLLVEGGAAINALDRYVISALVIAIRRGNERRKVAEYLLDHGAEPNKQDGNGRTCLFYAAEVGDGKACRLLLEKGADVNVIDDSGWSAYDVACEKGFHELSELLYLVRSTKWKPGDNPSLMKDIEEKDASKDKPAEGVSVREDTQIEMLLGSMNATKYFQNFRKHRVTYFQFLQFDEEDMQALGIEEVGIRKKLLDAIREVQNQDWDKKSLKWVHSNKKVTAAETVCIINNINMHIQYICTTLRYLRRRIRKDPKNLQIGREKNKLQDMILLLKEMDKHNYTFEEEILELLALIDELKNNAEFKAGDEVKLEPKAEENFLKRWDALKKKKLSRPGGSSGFVIKTVLFATLVAVGCGIGWRKFIR